MDTPNIIALIAVVISFGSFLLSGKSYRNSARALRIAESEQEGKSLPVQSYLIDSFSFKNKSKAYCSFAISFTNLASIPQSFSSLELEVDFYDEDGVYGKAKCPPELDISPLGLNEDYKRLTIPLNIAPKETVSGWVTFILPISEHRKFRFESYRVSGKTGDGKESHVEAYLLRSVSNDEEN